MSVPIVGRGPHESQRADGAGVRAAPAGRNAAAGALTDLKMVASNLQQAYPENYPASAGFTATALSLRDELTRGFRPTLWILLGAAGFLLLIVCASVANLMLARLLKREREMAIRMSLGAGRWRLVQQLLTESTLLALAGAVVGLLLAAVMMDLLVTLAGQFTTRAQEISLNGTVLLFTLGIATATGMLVGAIPALPGRISLSSAIQEGGRTVSAGRGSLRSTLIVAQVAVSFVLLIGAGLMLRSVLRLQSVDAGIRTESVLSMRVALNFTKYTTPALRAQFLTELADRLRALPGVRSAGGAGTFPMNDGGGFLAGVRIEGQPEVETARLPRAEVQSATPGYFQTVGIPLLKGRLLDDRDIADREAVVVVSESMARQFFSQAEAVGARISIDNGRNWLRIVGVVGDVRNALASQPSQTFYRPLAQAPLLTVMFLARTSGDAAGLAQQMRAAVHAIDAAPAGRSVSHARRGAIGLALGAAFDGDADRRLRRHRAPHHGCRPRRRDRVFGQSAFAGVRRAHGAWRLARGRCSNSCSGRACGSSPSAS